MLPSTITLGTCIRFVGIASLIVLIVVYVQFQARDVILGPTITLNGTYTPVQHERTVALEGLTHNIVKLTLNGREIHTTIHGEFSQSIVLEKGYTIIELHAEDRFGRTTSLRRAFVYVPLATETGGV